MYLDGGHGHRAVETETRRGSKHGWRKGPHISISTCNESIDSSYDTGADTMTDETQITVRRY